MQGLIIATTLLLIGVVSYLANRSRNQFVSGLAIGFLLSAAIAGLITFVWAIFPKN